MNILLCTLGTSWAVIPEIFGFLAPDKLDLYRDHPDAEALARLREEFRLESPDEIWVCTTEGAQTREGLVQLHDWRLRLASPPAVRVWQGAGTDQLASQNECRHLRELILRACLLAHQQAGNGQVVLSLAGGRKTMSADMQWAGSLLGCAALVHVVGCEPLPATLKSADPALMSEPLALELALNVVPVVVAPGRRSELLDIDRDGLGPISGKRFPLPLAKPDATPLAWPAPGAALWLDEELRRREQEGTQLLGNYLATVSRDEHHENWRSLYRLPPRIIDALRQQPLTADDLDFLTRLPKADLHRHLGGCLSLAEQRRVAWAVWEELDPPARALALEGVRPWLEEREWPARWSNELRHTTERAHGSAALLVHASDEQLQHNLYAVTEPRVALKDRQGFSAYELPGELSGSALLSHPAAIAAYAQAVVSQAVTEGLAYVELRGSPQKYGDGLAFLRGLRHALQCAARQHGDEAPRFRFIVIADRRERARTPAVVDLAVQAHAEMVDFVVGIDLAGAEGTACPAELAPAFMRAFEACLPVTIHAGEGESAQSIWQAAYHLHADRIGHGLSIGDHEALAARFRDRGICLELCPSSNREVVGFCDPALPATASYPRYPLLKLWRQGLPLTLCTDNPGISRTTLTQEYLAAARMVDGELFLWDTLAMLKQAFTHAFLPSVAKEALLKYVDAKVYEQVARRWLSPGEPLA